MVQTVEKSVTKRIGVAERRFWDDDSQALYHAVADACYIYGYRDLERNLRRFGWRQARRRILRHCALSGEWVGRGRGEVRLRRKGLEVRFSDGARIIGWKELQEFVGAWRR
jgi:hypothetical protein